MIRIILKKLGKILMRSMDYNIQRGFGAQSFQLKVLIWVDVEKWLNYFSHISKASTTLSCETSHIHGHYPSWYIENWENWENQLYKWENLENRY